MPRPPSVHNAPMLEIVGLDAQAEQVYEVLLSIQSATVRDIVSATGLSTTTVRAALRLLEAYGLVSRTSRAPLIYQAIDPGIALDVLLHEREEQLRKARVHAQEMIDRYRQTIAGRNPVNVVEVITGKATILQRLDQIQRSALHELRYFDKPPYHSDPKAPNEAEMDVLRNGVQARAIYETASITIPDRLPTLDLYVTAGEQARVLPALPTKLIIVDDRLAAVPVYQDVTETPAPSFVIVHRSALLDALCHLFETLWQVALPFGSATQQHTQAQAGEPDPLERRILELMNAGLPDQAIARHLNLSHRTLQRRIQNLMKRLNAYTRYQLGAQAAARGWDSPVAGVRSSRLG